MKGWPAVLMAITNITAPIIPPSMLANVFLPSKLKEYPYLKTSMKSYKLWESYLITDRQFPYFSLICLGESTLYDTVYYIET